MRVTVRGVILLVGLFFSLAAAPASSPPDAVFAPYPRFYRGEIQEAKQDLERLRTETPNRLAVRFGLVQILQKQTDNNRALEGEFEKALDAFIADADARYGRSDKDDESLFYLANAYLVRA